MLLLYIALAVAYRVNNNIFLMVILKFPFIYFVNNSRIKPANVQVEMHVQFQQKSLREFCQMHGLTICAYAPFASPGRNEFYSKLGLK